MRMSRFDQGLMSSCPLTRVICRGAACQIIFLLIPVLAKETWKLKIQISFKNPNPNCQLERRDLITAGTNLNAFDRLNYCWLQPRSPFERPSFKTAFCTTFSSVSSKIFLSHLHLIKHLIVAADSEVKPSLGSSWEQPCISGKVPLIKSSHIHPHIVVMARTTALTPHQWHHH